MFHYTVSNSITYLCMADDDEKRRVPFAFLDDVNARFRERYGDRARTAIAFAMNEEFARILQQQMTFFNADPAADNIGRVRAQINDVKDVMVQNIEKVLERGEKIELLVDKTDKLNNAAFKFERQSKKLKNAMWWRNLKMKLMIGMVVALVLYIILGMACGFAFQKCKSSPSPAPAPSPGPAAQASRLRFRV